MLFNNLLEIKIESCLPCIDVFDDDNISPPTWGMCMMATVNPAIKSAAMFFLKSYFGIQVIGGTIRTVWIKSMQRRQCPIHNGILQSIVWSSRYLQFWKMITVHCGFSTKVTCTFLMQENMQELSKINTFKPRKTTISSTLLIR